MRRAFTLVELLSVVAILAILYAIFLPAIIAVRAAAKASVASSALKNYAQAFTLYAADADDYAPVAMYQGDLGFVTWFGLQTAPGTFDASQGIISPYLGGKVPIDPIFQARPWLGNGSGFGYNWGYIGSDFLIRNDLSGFPNCSNPAQLSSLTDSSQTVVFATSDYFYAPWLPGGDGQEYDFGFIDPPRLWNGNPDVDFRHQGDKTVNVGTKTVTSTGHAIVVRADASAKARRQTALTDAQFER